MDRPPNTTADYIPTTVPPPVPPPPVIIDPVTLSQSSPAPPHPLTAVAGSAAEWAPPTSESVKLFVGQVPKHFDEEDLRPYLEPYGPIGELLILRHKSTRQHKGKGEREEETLSLLLIVGCAFVTYLSRESAELAQRELHDKVALPTVRMRWRDGEEREREEML